MDIQRQRARRGLRPARVPYTDPTEAPPVASAVSATAPSYVRYLDQREQAYLVRELDSGRAVPVRKRRDVADPYPPAHAKRAPGMRLLRWSGYAVLGVGIGGAPAIVLGLLSGCIAIVRLTRFNARTRRWWYRHRHLGAPAPLPAVATDERLRLLAALGQSLLAIALGCVVLALLAGYLF